MGLLRPVDAVMVVPAGCKALRVRCGELGCGP